MKRTQLTTIAKADLKRISDHLDSPKAARRIVNQILSRCNLLGANPKLGRDRPELQADLRSYPAGEHVIFFRVTSNGVKVVRIFYGGRDATEDDFA